LLRESAADPGNDHRLGANEAPPAIISVFLGEQLEDVMEQLVSTGEATHSLEGGKLRTGVRTLPDLAKDATDRNRTSPFAFTGNKFEFRMVGSNMSIAKANITINTAVAESLRLFADELEGATDFNAALHALIKRTIREHKRILFNGNSYDEEWVREAEARGLLNLKTTPEALSHMLHEKNVALYERHKVFSRAEMLSRYGISLENYCKLCNIEAVTMYKLIRKNIIFVATSYAGELSKAALAKREFQPAADCSYERDTVLRLSEISAGLYKKVGELYDGLCQAEEKQDALEKARFFKDAVLTKMAELRELADELELLVSRQFWPFPTYGDLLFSVR